MSRDAEDLRWHPLMLMWLLIATAGVQIGVGLFSSKIWFVTAAVTALSAARQYRLLQSREQGTK